MSIPISAPIGFGIGQELNSMHLQIAAIASGNLGPWTYASIAAAEASGDTWLDGDTITITGVSEFLYLSALDVGGYSGLIHKEPFGSGNGTISAVTLRINETEKVDPDAWNTTPVYAQSGGSVPTNFEYTTDAGNDDHTLIWQKSTAYNVNVRCGGASVDAITFALWDSMQSLAIAASEAGAHELWIGAYIGVSNTRLARLSSNLGTTWYAYNGSTYTDTGILSGTRSKIFLYCNATSFCIWGADDSSPTTITPITSTGTAYQVVYRLGKTNAPGGTNKMWPGTMVAGGITL